MTKTLLDRRMEYWFKRLDHTLQHTQTSTRQIYLVDGAVLAFVYFVIQEFGIQWHTLVVAALPIYLLVVLNRHHANLIVCQGGWYRGIRTRLETLLDEQPIFAEVMQSETERRELQRGDAVHKRIDDNKNTLGTHQLYAKIHKSISVVLELVGLAIVASGSYLLSISMG